MTRTSKTSRRASDRPKYTFCQEGRWWYFRHRLTGVSRLRGAPGEPQFHRDYADKLAAVERAKNAPAPAKDTKNTFAWLADQYQRSPEFKQLGSRTQRDYSGLLGYAIEKIGDLDYRSLKHKHMVVLRNSRADAPRRADYLIAVVSAAYSWKIKQGDEEGLTNPCENVDKLHKKVTGIEPWTEDQIEHFLTNCAEEFRFPILLGLHTGQRISDCVAMGVERWTGRTITLITGKTREFIQCNVNDELLEALKNRPHQDQPKLITGKSGKPYKLPESLGSRVSVEAKRLGLPPLSFHGLRYAACARLEDAGLTPWEIRDIVGHRTFEMAKQYAEKRRLRAKVQSHFEKSAKSEKGDP